eukprot:Nitzschia sp. Nitz4//scaffold138_size62050//29492//31602//NITZ4_006389-RA/size62050-augustus-gene-0.29-mRNA-1//-1//CDS//3329535770//6572//frame0
MLHKVSSVLVSWLLLLALCCDARPVVRSIRSAHEFDRLLRKHSEETGLPVVVDFYSDSCGPCRMMAPVFKQVAADFVGQAVFVKVDTNAQYELSSRYQIRSLPTFQWFVAGKQWNEAKGGIGEQPLRQMTRQAIVQAELENVILSLDSLTQYYAQVDPSKSTEDVANVYQKCLTGKNKQCMGATASTLIRKLKKKYNQVPTTEKRWLGDDSHQETDKNDAKSSSPNHNSNNNSNNQKSSSKSSNLHLATIDQLKAELEKRQDELREAELEQETDEDEEAMDAHYRWSGPGEFPERVVIVGGGPAGLAAAVYAARAGLTPLVLAPSMGGQLQGKGVDVENYPGIANVTGPAVIAAMRQQAAGFGAVFEEDVVVGIDASSRPLKVLTNQTDGAAGNGQILTHSIIVATGADSKWLGVPGEYELRGGGVSACAICDGFLYAGKHVVVVGGGDAAMEDALVLARTSKKVTLVHRRDSFRASKVLSDRVKDHPNIQIEWNTVVHEIQGTRLESDGDAVDLDAGAKVVSGAVLKDVESGELRNVACDAVFVAIGHLPNTGFLQGVVDFDPEHPGYIQTKERSTKTSVEGIFAAGDVSDAVYRQAITSAGTGAAAALDAERWLSEEGLGFEAAQLEAELLAELLQDMPMTAGEEVGYNAYEEAGGKFHGVKESVGAEL